MILALRHTEGLPATPAELLHHWSTGASVVLPLLLGAALYGRGLAQLWRRAGWGRGVAPRRAAAFCAGTLVLGIALVSPVDAAGEVLFSAHMVQHLLLILVGAPLLVVGAPERVMLWALPPRGRRTVGRWAAAVQRAAGALAAPVPAVAIATATLWLWHVPALYDLAVSHDGAHALEHSAFLLTALLFWWSLLHIRTRRADAGNGLRLMALFAMVLQGSLLGALITFAGAPLYASHAAIPEAFALSPLEDQQLAGLLMWVPPAALYLGVAAHLFVRWLDSAGAARGSSAPAPVRPAPPEAGAASGD